MRILIPTRNSARWIAHVAEGYRALGVRPFYLVDKRSTDATETILRDRAEDVATYLPSGDFAEAGMIEAGASLIDHDWILRLDDDEFPCSTLVRVPTENLNPRTTYGIVRHEAVLAEKHVKLARWPADLCGHDGKTGVSVQYRLFNRAYATYDGRIHTPGLVAEERQLLDEALYVVHFNCVLRSPAQRLAKIRGYAQHNREVSYRVAEESLPELRRPHEYELREIPDSVTRRVATALPKAPGQRPAFNRGERALRRTLLLRDGKRPNPFRRFPIGFQRRAAELLSTVARITGSSTIKDRADSIWRDLVSGSRP